MDIKDRVKELRRVKASQLLPNPRNWRTHPKAQADALRGVLAELGYADALLARETPAGLMLIDGHLRAETTPDAVVPVLVLDLDDAEADKLLATLDPLAAMATADAAKLDALLHDVRTGSAAVEEMLADLASANPVLVAEGAGGDDFDATPEEEGPPRTALGDLWVIGDKHRLLVGDCTVAENVARLLQGGVPFLMVTDPPYGVEYEPGWRDGIVGEFGAFACERSGVANDDIVDWSGVFRASGADVAYVWHASWFIAESQRSLIGAGYLPRSQVIWAKQHFAISRGHYHWQHEPCWYAVKKGKTARWTAGRDQTTLWEISSLNPAGRVEEREKHGTQKPLECMARPIRNHGEPGDIVYDPFLGSGTTLIAAHRLGRVCYGCELDPRYADVVLKRAEAEGLACAKSSLQVDL